MYFEGLSQYHRMKIVFLLFPAFLFFLPKANSQASFLAPDTVCVNQPVNITNTSTNASSYYWNFCVADINGIPTGTNLGNVNNSFSAPVFMDYVFYNNNYYGFLINYDPGNLIRLDFGNSLLNTPTSINLGNFGGIIPPGAGAEGIQLVFNEGRWYAIIVGGWPVTGSNPRILKIDFGSDLTNINPVATNWGNLGNMLQPIDLHVFKEGNNWYGLTVNAENHTITRFNFTNSFNNTPTAINLGNIGNLEYPTGIFAINDNGFWRVFVTNGGNNTRSSGTYSLTRLDFGSSLLNTPTGLNLGNPGAHLQHPRDLTIMKLCNRIIGFAVNGHFNNSNIIKLNFNNDLSTVPTMTTLGIIGNSSFPHSISKLFRVNNDVYGFITNVDNNTITRLKFDGCSTSNMSSSSAESPPPITYATPGIYSINLTVDDGLPTQSAFCKNIIVMPELQHTPTKNLSFCAGDSVLLTSNFSSRNKWNSGSATNSIYARSGGLYWVETTNGACINRDTFIVTAVPAPFQVDLGKDTSICPSDELVLNAGNSGFSYLWSTSATTQSINVNTQGKYYVAVSANGCTASDTISISFLPKLPVSIIGDTTICKNSSIQLFASGGTSYSWSPASSLSDPFIQNPLASPVSNTTYYLTAVGVNGCATTDSVKVNIWPEPLFKISPSKSICSNDSVEIQASGGISYRWQPSASLSNFAIANPSAAPQTTTTYTVLISDNCNNSKSLSTTITVRSPPNIEINKSNDIDCITPVSQLQVTGGVRYDWSPVTYINFTNIANPIVSPHEDTWYHVLVTDPNGCTAKDSVLILTSFGSGSGTFYIPNAFTPNNDGKNDCFGVQYWGALEIFELSIYNRWGEKIFFTKDSNYCWNGQFEGKRQPSGTYIYQIKVQSLCTNGVVYKKGHLTLIR